MEPNSQSPSKMLSECQPLKEATVEPSRDSPDRILQAPRVPFPVETWVGLVFRRSVCLFYPVFLPCQWTCSLMGRRHRSGTDHAASSYLKCLRFLSPNKLIANTLVSSCADCLSREGLRSRQGHTIILWELGCGVRRLLKNKDQ